MLTPKTCAIQPVCARLARYLDGLDRNPLYEMLLPWGALTAARINARLGGAGAPGASPAAPAAGVDLQKLLDWCMRGDAWVRVGWGATIGEYGNQSVDGLVGSQLDGGGYAFFANTAWTLAALLPIAR